MFFWGFSIRVLRLKEGWLKKRTSINFCMSGYYISGLLMTCHNRIILPYICLSYAHGSQWKAFEYCWKLCKIHAIASIAWKDIHRKKIYDGSALTTKPRRIGQRKSRLFVTKLPYRKKFQIFKLVIFSQMSSPCLIHFPYGYNRNLRN